MLKFEKKKTDSGNFRFFYSIFGLTIRVFDGVYDYLILHFTAVFSA